jgi:hypothetical protein
MENRIMESNVISQYLDLVNLQIAAEAFLVNNDGSLKQDIARSADIM